MSHGLAIQVLSNQARVYEQNAEHNEAYVRIHEPLGGDQEGIDLHRRAAELNQKWAADLQSTIDTLRALDNRNEG